MILADRLRALAAEPVALRDPGAALRRLVDDGLADLPRPGQGQTLARWQALAAVAAHDLSLVKLFEGHTDALAILAEAGVEPEPGRTYGMWAAEPPDVPLRARLLDGDALQLVGTKAWCSGAQSVDRGLLTVRAEDGSGPWLADVDLHQPGVTVDVTGWEAVGMAGSASGDVHFEASRAHRVGAERFYLTRPGFWQGGAGIAACWHGATVALAGALRRSARSAPVAGWHRTLALGKIDRLLSANGALLREAAAWIDAHPQADARAWALRTRAAADEAAQDVLALATRALGAGPLCRDADFARRAADLPVFIRQCHADRDLSALGELLLSTEDSPWML